MTTANTTTAATTQGKKHCMRCGHVLWYCEEKNRWYCTNPKCVKYKPQPTE